MKITRYLFVLLVLTSCKKENPEPAPLPSGPDPCFTNKVPVSADLKKAAFNPGTYWVLYDSIAATYDSLLVKDTTLTYAQYPHSKGQTCSWADRIIVALTQYRYAASGTPSLVTGEYLCIISEKQTINLNGYITNFPVTGPMIYYDFDSEPKPYFPITRLDSIFILNRYMKRVIKSIGPIRYESSSGSAPMSDRSIYHHYFNTDIGFLKVVRYDSSQVLLSSKALVRYNLAK